MADDIVSCHVTASPEKVTDEVIQPGLAKRFGGDFVDANQRHAGRANGPTLAERFWSKVDKNGPLSAECGDRCWVWNGSRGKAGYGQFGVGRVPLKAHVVSWALSHGGLRAPVGVLVCHRCDNPPCVNPDHLFLGTYADNSRDAQMKGRLGRPFASTPRRVRAKVPPRPRTTRVKSGALIEWLALVGVNESQAAQAVGISRQAMNFFTTGQCRPSAATAALIEEFTFGAVPASAWGGELIRSQSVVVPPPSIVEPEYDDRPGRCVRLDEGGCRCLLKSEHGGGCDYSYTPWRSVLVLRRDGPPRSPEMWQPQLKATT